MYPIQPEVTRAKTRKAAADDVVGNAVDLSLTPRSVSSDIHCALAHSVRAGTVRLVTSGLSLTSASRNEGACPAVEGVGFGG